MKFSETSEWYLKISKEAGLFDYAPIKGSIVIKPYGFAIWERIQKVLDKEFKKRGVKNAYFPSLIPYSIFKREKEHLQGFSPEIVLATIAGNKKLKDPLVLRPTSETIMYYFFKNWISSWRDLPFKINQWVNVIRWELRPYPFLRTTEFLWHEAHTAHRTEKEAKKEVKDVIKLYQNFFKEYLAIPVIVGVKSETEKFAGAISTVTCEALLTDRKALQLATAHNLGQNFSKMFEIKFKDKDKKEKYVWQTSWGLSTRVIGAVVLTHRDKKGLILPPKIAPIQIIIIPILKKGNKKRILAFSEKVLKILQKTNLRAEIDQREQYTPGWKFNEWELKGVPLRIEIGEKETKIKKLTLVERVNRKKFQISLKNLQLESKKILEKIQKKLLEKARKFYQQNTYQAKSFEEFAKIIKERQGFLKVSWCGSKACEQKIKEKTKATNRCIISTKTNKNCIFCKKKGKYKAIFALSH